MSIVDGLAVEKEVAGLLVAGHGLPEGQVFTEKEQRKLVQAEFCKKVRHIVVNNYMSIIDLAVVLSVKGSTLTSWQYLGRAITNDGNSATAVNSKGYPAFALANGGMIYLDEIIAKNEVEGHVSTILPPLPQRPQRAPRQYKAEKEAKAAKTARATSAPTTSKVASITKHDLNKVEGAAQIRSQRRLDTADRAFSAIDKAKRSSNFEAAGKPVAAGEIRIANDVKVQFDKHGVMMSAAITKQETTISELLSMLSEESMVLVDQLDAYKETVANIEAKLANVSNTISTIRNMVDKKVQ